MTQRTLHIIGLVLLALTGSARFVAAQSAAYDALEAAYAPYMDRDDPLSFAMKIQSISQGPYKFWRGGKDLFYRWARTAAADWLADPSSYVVAHGDLHFGNIGTYAADPVWGQLSFGMVDLDDSSFMPFQIELLGGMVTLELTALDNDVQLSDRQRRELLATLLESYRQAAAAPAGAAQWLRNSPRVRALLAASGCDYERELATYLENGRFRTVIRSKSGQVKEILRPVGQKLGAIRAALAEATERSQRLRSLLGDRHEAPLRIKDAVLRTRLGSSGSQGLSKYFVLVGPVNGMSHDLIVYLKQQIPAAAERAGAIAAEPMDGGARLVRHLAILSEVQPWLSTWCRIGDESYWLTFKEPWSQELDPSDFADLESLADAARLWGWVAGAAHGRQNRQISERITTDLEVQLAARSAAYVARLLTEFAEFRADARTAAQIERAQRALKALTAP
jgi:uncharacterized protein (DUF2252 family)